MDSTYAPRSPDLSSFLSSPSKSQQPFQPQPSPSAVTYAPRSPVIPSFNNPAVAAPTSQYNHPAYANNQHHPFGGALGGYGGGAPTDTNLEFDAFGNAQYMPPIPALPPQHSFNNPPPQHPNSPYFQQQQQQQPQYAQPNPHFRSEDSYTSTDADGEYISSPNTMTSRQPRGKGLASAQPASQYKDPNPNNIEIKTKFPVARIKRIMQADEEVGKVAQVTPVAVSKALELFMIALVSGAAEKAKEKGGKRVTAQHLKQVVLGSPEQFDFLAEIVGRVAEVTEGAGGEGRKRKEKVSNDGGSDSSEEEKKVKKGKGRRKKGDD